jgi:3-keto-5-aminohexanoate cleavage enzyme
MSAAIDPVVVCVAPNGARRGKADHARIPLTAAELATEAEAIADAGAHALHLHVRDADGEHSLDPKIYRQALDAIRTRIGERLVVQVTTESVGIYAPEQQMAVIRELVPPCASVAIRELIREPAHEKLAAAFFAWACKAGVGLQFIIYEPADVVRLASLQASGVVPIDKPHALFVLGRKDGMSNPQDLLPFANAWPADWPWTACAFGRTEPLCLAAAVALGGHVRVGFENNLLAPDGTPARDNAAAVTNIVQLIGRTGRQTASATQARALYLGV